MKTRNWVWMAICLLGMARAQDLDVFVTSFAADGRIRVMGQEAEWIPRISMWSERALEQLERDWNLRLPFLKELPLELRLDGDRVGLEQQLRNRKLRQRILLPGSPEQASVSELSELFVTAMLTRLQWGAGVELPGTPPVIRTTWTSGAASSMIPGRAERLAQQALQTYDLVPPPTPELIRADAEVDSFLLYRWIQDTMLSQRNASRFFWGRVSRNPRFEVTDWVEVTPGVNTLRQLHQDWEVWWQAERQVLISEFGLEAEARRWLMQELNPIPRFYGLDAEAVDPHLPATLTEYGPYLEHPRFFSAMTQWIYRLQAVRFRQAPVFNDRVLAFEQALEMSARSIRPNRSPRKGIWEDAQEMWGERLNQLP